MFNNLLNSYLMDPVKLDFQMEIVTRAIGLMDFKMAMELKYKLMVIFMKAIGKVARKRVMVLKFG